MITGEANVPQCPVIKTMKAFNGGPTAEIARDPLATVDEQPRRYAGPLDDSGKEDR